MLAEKLSLDEDKITDEILKKFWIANNKDLADKKITEKEYELYKQRKLKASKLEELKIKRVTKKEISSYNTLDKKAAYIYYLMHNGYSYDDKIIKEEITDEELAYVEENKGKLNGVSVVTTWKRVYPYGDLLKGILGSVSTSSNGIPKDKKIEYLKKYGKHTIVHVHGWSHALSASIFKACLDNDVIPFVTLHDYFSVCPNGGFYNFKEQHVCGLKPMNCKCVGTNCDARNYMQKIYRLIRQCVQDKYVKNNDRVKYIYISDYSFSKLKKCLKSKNCFYLHNPVDEYPIDKVNAINNNSYLYIGRISPEKGADVFCKAISQLGIKGTVIGDGPLKKELAKKFPMIEFAGWKSKQDILPYIKQARCLIFPSKCYEGAPLTTEECLNAGIPCIVSDVCAATDQIEDGVNGYIFKSEDVEDLKNKIVMVEESTQIFNIGSWKIKNYSLENYIYELLKIYFG